MSALKRFGLPIDSFACLAPLPGVANTRYVSLRHAEVAGAGPLSQLPYSLRVLAEHLLRREDGRSITRGDIEALGQWVGRGSSTHSVSLYPARILMQDSAGIPVLADLTALDEAVRDSGGNPASVAPRLPMDMVVDHAVEVDEWASSQAMAVNLGKEFERHGDRYRFLKWAAGRFPGLRVAPPGVGICHQLNLEVIAELVRGEFLEDGSTLAGFDSVLGTDSHTTMVNGLSVFGWGVGGIEAMAALLGEPVVMRIPEVVGVRLNGQLRPGAQATDLALALTAELRKRDLVQKFVEFCGAGLDALSVPDRATVANMAPEYGATMGYFPPDAQTIDYLRGTGRSEANVARAETFLRAQGIFRDTGSPEPTFTDIIDFDLGSVGAIVAGPSRPHQKNTLSEVPATLPRRGSSARLDEGSVVIAAITSCTNTSNPRALLAAGLLARNAVARGLKVPSWTKTSFAPGSRVASQLLADSGLQDSLDRLGFQVVGHGCTTCMGNSGPLPSEVQSAISERGLSVSAVLSGNRNFEGRIHPAVRQSYLASPALVVAYALAGTMNIDLSRDLVGTDTSGQPVTLANLWPSVDEVEDCLQRSNQPTRFLENRQAWLVGTPAWDALEPLDSERYPWEGEAGFIRKPPFLDIELREPQLLGDLTGARPLVVLHDGTTTDHISPVSRIPPDSAAGRWLLEHGVAAARHGSYSARRLNHDVMLRGGFANPRLRNLLVPGIEGGLTRLLPGDEVMPIHEAAADYRRRAIPAIVIAGSGYGAGSARDWAAKVTRLLGVRAVIARSFERIHRANLIAFGVLPLQYGPEITFALDGSEQFDILGLPDALRPGGLVELVVRKGYDVRHVWLQCRIDTDVEAQWLRAGGVLAKVISDQNNLETI